MSLSRWQKFLIALLAVFMLRLSSGISLYPSKLKKRPRGSFRKVKP